MREHMLSTINWSECTMGGTNGLTFGFWMFGNWSDRKSPHRQAEPPRSWRHFRHGIPCTLPVYTQMSGRVGQCWTYRKRTTNPLYGSLPAPNGWLGLGTGSVGPGMSKPHVYCTTCTPCRRIKLNPIAGRGVKYLTPRAWESTSLSSAAKRPNERICTVLFAL